MKKMAKKNKTIKIMSMKMKIMKKNLLQNLMGITLWKEKVVLK